MEKDVTGAIGVTHWPGQMVTAGDRVLWPSLAADPPRRRCFTTDVISLYQPLTIRELENPIPAIQHVALASGVGVWGTILGQGLQTPEFRAGLMGTFALKKGPSEMGASLHSPSPLLGP